MSTNVYKPDSASHWYLVDDNSVKSYHSVPYTGARGKKGETRRTSLRDARKVGAFPSVTNVLSILHKEFLVAYKVNQAILAALTLPRLDGESADEFGKRVAADSKEHAASAARLGNRLHEVGAAWLTGKTANGEGAIEEGEMVEGRCLKTVSAPMIELLYKITPTGLLTDEKFSEFPISHPLGFGGTCDGLVWLDPSEIIVKEKLEAAGYGHLTKKPLIVMADIKSRGSASKKAPVYETDVLQLAAYLHAIPTTPNLGFPMTTENTPVANIMISTHPKAGTDGYWSADLIIHPKDEIDKAWEIFKNAHALWCWVKNYNPQDH